MTDVTRLLTAAEAGDVHAAAELLPLVYDELRKLAAARLAHEKPGQTLSATALVHEAYVKLVGGPGYDGRGHFFAAAAEAMRRILVDQARRKGRERHGGGLRRVDLDAHEPVALDAADELVALDEALTVLEQRDPVKASLVKLRFFAGLSVADAAVHLGISRATADRYWAFARAWLYERLQDRG